MGQLDSRVAIITGADSGIGRAIAIQFAQEGATVVVNYAHAQDKAEQVQQIIEQNHGKAFVIQADVSQYQQATGLIAQAVEHFDRVDIMVNNAGKKSRFTAWVNRRRSHSLPYILPPTPQPTLPARPMSSMVDYRSTRVPCDALYHPWPAC